MIKKKKKSFSDIFNMKKTWEGIKSIKSQKEMQHGDKCFQASNQ